MKAQIDLANDKVKLFLLEPEHVSAEYVGWLNNPVVNQYLESRFVEHDFASTLAYVSSVYESTNNLFLGITSLELDRHVGNVKIGPIDFQHRTGEVGIMIGDEAAWGKGVATAALKAVIELSKNRLGLRKLTAGCYASNVGSERAFIKAGFEIEGRREEQFILNDKPEALVLMGCLL